MKTKMFVFALLFAAATAFAQEAAAPGPTLDTATKELVSALVSQDVNAAKAVRARLEAMMATAEGKAYQAEVQGRAQQQATIQKQVETKVPGFMIDFATGQLVRQPKPAK